MSFDLLSNELVAAVFSHLEQVDAIRISLCCRRFRDVAEPFVYSAFVQTRKQDMALLLRTLIEKPYLSKYLKHFTGSMIDSDSYHGVEPGVFDLEVYLRDPNLRQWIHDQLPKSMFWPSRINTWRIHLCNNKYWDPICAFLLWLCSENLQTIVMDSYGAEIADWVDYLLQQAQIARNTPALPSPFPRLRRVELRNRKGNIPLNFNAILPYLKLDTVKEFEGSGIGYTLSVGEFDENLKFGTESLVLTTCWMRAAVLVRFLLCFHQLKRLKYEHAGVLSQRTERFWPSSIRKGLQNSKHCLEELVVNVAEQRWSPMPARPEYILGLSDDFESLRVLDVNSRAMFGVEYESSGTVPRMLYDLEWTEETYRHQYTLDFLACQNFASSLPPKLEHLVIRDCTAAIYKFLGVLVYGGSDRTGMLKTLEIEFFPRFQPGDWTGQRWYKEALRRGIKVVVRYLRSDGAVDVVFSRS